MSRVFTFTCPECERPWTGSTDEAEPKEEKVCKDCEAKKKNQ